MCEIEKKVSDHNHDKYITTPEFNKLTTENLKARLAQANLVTKTDFDIKLQAISKIITSNKTKHLLGKNELKKLQKIDSSYFRGKNYFDDDGIQHYLVFQPMFKYFKTISSINSTSEWNSKGLSNESIKMPSTSNNLFNPLLDYINTKIKRVKFSGSCLKQDKARGNHGAIVNICIVYGTSKNYHINSCPTLEKCLFGADSLTKHVDIDHYKYSGYVYALIKKGRFHLVVMDLVEM